MIELIGLMRFKPFRQNILWPIILRQMLYLCFITFVFVMFAQAFFGRHDGQALGEWNMAWRSLVVVGIVCILYLLYWSPGRSQIKVIRAESQSYLSEVRTTKIIRVRDIPDIHDQMVTVEFWANTKIYARPWANLSRSTKAVCVACIFFGTLTFVFGVLDILNVIPPMPGITSADSMPYWMSAYLEFTFTIIAGAIWKLHR